MCSENWNMRLSKNKLAKYSVLSQGKMREKHKLFIAEGLKNVSDLIGSFEMEALIFREGSDCAFSERLDSIGEERVFEVSADDMKKLSCLSTPSDILGVFKIPQTGAEDLIADKRELYLMLDGVRDPGNMGTIIRTAHWFGIERIYASMDCVDIFNPKTVMSAMGSLGKVQVVYCDLLKVVEKNPSMCVYGTFLDGENIYKIDLKGEGFIVMGNEGKGISDAMASKVTDKLYIPPYRSDNHPESLNVAISTAVTLALFRK